MEEHKPHEGHSGHEGGHDAEHQGKHHNPGHKPKHEMPEIPKIDFKNINAAALKSGFADVLAILKLDKAAMEKVAMRDGEGISMALVYLAIGAVAPALGGVILGYTFLGATIRTDIVPGLIGALVSLVMAAVVIYVTSLVAEKLFKGKGKFPEFFRVLGYASLIKVVGFLTIIPLLGTIAAIWLLVVSYMALTVVHKLDSTNAVLTIIVTIVAMVLLAYVLAAAGLSAVGMGGYGGLGFSLS